MSNDIRYPLDLARYIAEEIEFSIMPYCKRVVIAGSIRREKPEVGDIEIVCEPVAPKTNFATLIPKLSVIKNGEKYTQLLLPEGIKLDLFKVTPPAQWGVILTLRTGWGTALKPAYEPIILARKPISEKNIALNVLKWGVGGINIDNSRIETKDNLGRKNNLPPYGNPRTWSVSKTPPRDNTKNPPTGRFPANVLLECICSE